jgi:hypothetical protein
MRVLFLLAFAATQLAQAALPDFLPPNTKVVIGLSVRGLVDSPLLAGLGDAKTTTAKMMPGPLAGLDPLKDIDDLVIASAGEGENPPALIVVRGRFAQQVLPEGAKIYKGVAIYEDTKTPNESFALLDAGTLIGGDLAMVRAAIDRRGQPSGIAQGLVERVRVLSSEYDLWGAGELPPGIASKAGTPEVQSIDRFEFGAALRHGLEFSAKVHVKSTKDAEKLMQSIQMLKFMIDAQPKKEGGAKFDLQSDHDTLKLALFIPEEELKKGIEAQKANLATALTVRTAAQTPAPAPPAVLTPTPGSILKDQKGDTVMVTLPRK